MTRPWYVLCRADSGAQVPPGTAQELRGLPAEPRPVDVRISTGQADVGLQHTLAAGMLFEVSLEAESAQAAADLAASVSTGLCVMASFTANVGVDPAKVLYVIEAGDNKTEREVLHWVREDVLDLSRPGRTLHHDEFSSVVTAVVTSLHAEALLRGMSQYDAALRNWSSSGQPMALAHIFMAAEALAGALAAKRLDESGLTREAHATTIGVDVSVKGWPGRVAAAARAVYVFKNDQTVHKAVREASDGFEHGSKPLSHLRTAATEHAAQALTYIRAAILDLLDLESSLDERLRAKQVTDREPPLIVLPGVLSGPPGSLLDWAADDGSVPRIEARSLFVSSDRNAQGDLLITTRIQAEVVAAPGVSLTIREYAVGMGLNDLSRFTWPETTPSSE